MRPGNGRDVHECARSLFEVSPSGDFVAAPVDVTRYPSTLCLLLDARPFTAMPQDGDTFDFNDARYEGRDNTAREVKEKR